MGNFPQPGQARPPLYTTVYIVYNEGELISINHFIRPVPIPLCVFRCVAFISTRQPLASPLLLESHVVHHAMKVRQAFSRESGNGIFSRSTEYFIRFHIIGFFFLTELKLAGQTKGFDIAKEKRGQLSPAPDCVML